MQETTLQTDQPQTIPLAETNGGPAPAPTAGPGAMIVFESVTKIYEPDVSALSDVTFVIEKGEFVFVVGASGSGKSTIVRLILKELEPTRGRIIVGGRDLARLRRSKVPLLRRNVGCVFQDFKLLPSRTASENVAYALKVQGESNVAIRRKVPEVMNMVGLAHKMNSYPDELSGGEQQRVSIARAYVRWTTAMLVRLQVIHPRRRRAKSKRCKDAGSPHSRAMGATEDAAARRVIGLEDGRLARDERRGGYES